MRKPQGTETLPLWLSEQVPSDKTRRRLATFRQHLALWNKKTSLVSDNPDVFDEVAFADALELASLDVTPEGARVVDIGAGGGVPGIPLAILRPDITLYLVEPRRRRVAFMRTAIGLLTLSSRVSVHEASLDTKAPRLSVGELALGPIDLAYSRATFSPADWLVIGQQIAENVLVLASEKDANALIEDQTVASRLTSRSYRLPASGAARVLLSSKELRSEAGDRALQ